MYKHTYISSTSEDTVAMYSNVSACIHQRENPFFGSISGPFCCIPVFPLLPFLLCEPVSESFFAHDERTTQVPLATVSTHRKHSRTACNRPCTEQRSTYQVQQYVRVHHSAKTQGSRQEQIQVLPKATIYEYRSILYVLFPSSLPPTVEMNMPEYLWHSELWRTTV